MALPDLILVGGDGGYSGIPTYIAQMATALQRQANVTVISDKNCGGYDFVAQKGRQHVEIAGLRTTLNPLIWWRAARELSSVVQVKPQAIIWAQARMGVLLTRLLLMRGRLAPGQRIAITYHGLPFDPGHRRGWAWWSRQAEKNLLKYCPPHDLIFLSIAARTRFEEMIGQDICARHRLSVLMNCSDLGLVPPSAQSTGPIRTLVMTGRAGFQKNLAAAARIFAHLPETYRLVLCGSGTASPALQAQFARYVSPEAMSRITFKGAVADVRPVLAAADLYLMTSRYEGMPIGALEAFEAGLPLALSNINGTQEILETHPLSLSLSLQNPQAEAAAIDRMVELYLSNRPEKQREIHTRWAERFSYECWETEMRQLWKTLQKPIS